MYIFERKSLKHKLTDNSDRMRIQQEHVGSFWIVVHAEEPVWQVHLLSLRVFHQLVVQCYQTLKSKRRFSSRDVDIVSDTGAIVISTIDFQE